MTHSKPFIASDRPESTQQVKAMFDTIAPSYDILNTLLSGGLHRVWEGRLVNALPVNSLGRCLDLCTGTGALVTKLAKRYGEVIGVDISPGMLDVARRRWANLPNVDFIQGDAQSLELESESFDAVTVAYGVRNWPDPELGLREIRRILRVGGSVAILEFGQPRNIFWRKLFGVYSRYVIPFIGGAISGSRSAYEYLPKTSAVFPCGQSFEILLNSAGLRPVRTISLLGGVAFIYVARKSESE